MFALQKSSIHSSEWRPYTTQDAFCYGYASEIMTMMQRLPK